MKNNLNNISVIRVSAILLVVLGHSSIIYSGSWFRVAVVESKMFWLVYKLIYSFHMPLFVFVSGYLFYYSVVECRNDKGFANFVKKKAIRLLIPYFAVAIFWMIPIRLGIDFYGDVSFKSIFIKGIVLSGDTGSLWFLLMLFNIFCIFYIARNMLNQIKKKYSINPLIFIFAVQFFCLLAHLISVKVPFLDVKIPNIFQLRNTLLFIIYFYLGYLYRKCEYETGNMLINKYKTLHVALSAVVYIGLVTMTYLSLFKNKHYYVQESANLLIAISAIHFIYSGTLLIPSFLSKVVDNAFFKLLNRHNFSIYLLHAPIIYIITFRLYDEVLDPSYVVLSCFMSSIFTSIVISLSIEKTKILKPLLGLS